VFKLNIMWYTSIITYLFFNETAFFETFWQGATK
jgi:hypothetical protein